MNSSEKIFNDSFGKLRMYLVDTFTDKPFSGNPAAVCFDLPQQGIKDELLQRIAAEMNQSMTAFVMKINPSDQLETADRFKLRWFTPRMEWKLCGHATLASAFVLFTVFNNKSKEIKFDTIGGELVVRKEGDILAMNFPTALTIQQNDDDYTGMLEILFGDRDIVDSVHLCAPLGFLVIRLKDSWSRNEFESWEPHADRLPSVDNSGKVRMVMVTTRGRREAGYTNQNGDSYDFVSRIFTPWSGLAEDPVTGSAHTVLAKFWSDVLNKSRLYVRQCSQRPGDLWLEVKGDRTDVKGQAVLVMESRVIL